MATVTHNTEKQMATKFYINIMMDTVHCKMYTTFQDLAPAPIFT